MMEDGKGHLEASAFLSSDDQRLRRGRRVRFAALLISIIATGLSFVTGDLFFIVSSVAIVIMCLISVVVGGIRDRRFAAGVKSAD